MTVKLGHTTLSDLTITFANNFNSGAPVTVANAASFAVPGGIPVNGYVWLPFADGAFTYNGTDNLVVEVDVSAGTGTTFWRNHTGTGQIRLRGSHGSPIGATDSAAYDIQFRFHGGTMDVHTPNGISGSIGDGFPFNNVDGKRQYLYLASELGTQGAISTIACRAVVNSAAEGGLNYTVVISQTTATTLNATFAANLPTPVTVLSGTLSIPAVLRGDWLEIPLSTPFSYNGRDNLVVQIAGTGGTIGGATCVLDNTSTTLHAARRITGGSSGATTGSVADSLIDMRFTLQ